MSAMGVALVTVEFFLGGAWVDVTPDILVESGKGINITVGQGSQAFSPTFNEATFSMNNANVARGTSRAYNPLDPGGANWGVLLLGVDIRIASSGIFRFFGKIRRYDPIYNKRGNYSEVKIIARSISADMAKDKKYSPIAQGVMAQTGTAAAISYWPMEGSGTVTSFGSLTGGAPMGVNGITSFGGNTTLAGSDSLTAFPAGASARFSVPSYVPSGATATSTINFAFCPPTGGLTLACVLLDVQVSGVFRRVTVVFDPTSGGQLICNGYDASGALSTAGSAFGITALGAGTIHLNLRTSAGTAFASVTFSTFTATVSTAGTAGSFLGGAITPGSDYPGGAAFGHLSVMQGIPYSYLETGSPKEEADARMSRMALFRGGAVTVLDGSEQTEHMGVQPIDTPLGVILDAVSADGGLLFDSPVLQNRMYYASLRYLMGNLTLGMTLAVASGQVADPLAPTLDDKDVLTGATVSRPKGGSVGYSTVQGIGTYERSVTANVYSDARLGPMAEWLTSIGTQPYGRVSSIPIDLAKNSGLRASWLAARPTNYVLVTGHPDALSPLPLDYIIIGWTEFISHVDWDVSLNVIPHSPFRAGQAFSSAWGRVVPDSSVVSSTTSAATSFTVTTASGPAWITTAADTLFSFPIPCLLSTGETVSVTAISSATSPQTFTVVRSQNSIVKVVPAGTTITPTEIFILAR